MTCLSYRWPRTDQLAWLGLEKSHDCLVVSITAVKQSDYRACINENASHAASPGIASYMSAIDRFHRKQQNRTSLGPFHTTIASFGVTLCIAVGRL
jgi:hypothetical protein